MSEVRPDAGKIRRKIEFIRDAMGHLDTIRARPQQAFLSDPILQAAAARYLQVAIEAILDAANHIIERERLGLPETCQQSVDLLINAGVLPNEKADDLARMVRFHHRAVHLYDEVSALEVYDVLEHRLGDFESVIQALASRYL